MLIFCEYCIFEEKIPRLPKNNIHEKYNVTWLYNSIVLQSAKIQIHQKTEMPEVKLKH